MLSSSTNPARRHSTYYLASVVFLVEGILFKVPRHGFEGRPGIFSTTFSLPAGVEEPEGLSDQNPFALKGIFSNDFESLLKVMYPFNPNATSILNREEWTSALKLATMWEFTDIRKQAIDKLSLMDISVVDKIVLGKEYRISQWLLSGYQTLAETDEPLAVEDLKKLGWETIARLFEVREKDLFGRRCKTETENSSGSFACSCCSTCYGHSSSNHPYYLSERKGDLQDILRTVFQDELKNMEEE